MNELIEISESNSEVGPRRDLKITSLRVFGRDNKVPLSNRPCNSANDVNGDSTVSHFAMDLEIQERPRKKRRYFVDDPPTPEETIPSDQPPQENANTSAFLDTEASCHVSAGFDKPLFESFVGEEISDDVLDRLREVAGNDVERAINMYLDGSWKAPVTITSRPSSVLDTSITPTHVLVQDSPRPKPPDTPQHTPMKDKQHLDTMPENRYVGAFGVEAWATRSGSFLISPGEKVNVERSKTKLAAKVGRGGKAVQNNAKVRTDIIVRITNTRGEEIGRLPKEAAQWVSTLIDQQVCRFEGHCVFASDRIRINDSIFLQLRCLLLKGAFEASNFSKPESNRTTGIFEEKETSEERDLRLRQVALVKLFDEVNLHPSIINETTAKHKRQGILQAAEIAEQYDKDAEKTPKPVHENNSISADDDEGDGKELEQDQLDTLYKKAQSFDFDTPALEPASTFAMDLRKYQKQALHWMVSKEKDERSDHKEASMHPLWEEYDWPLQDVDNHALPSVVKQHHFYVNPYSGELSLKFPEQEQHCLGGILADGELTNYPCRSFDN